MGSNIAADLNIFLIPGYISIDFVFLFTGFMLFYRFCKFAVNILICDINRSVCSLKVLCVLISSSFSVRRQSTSVLYLVQGWQNVLSTSFATYIKSISRDPSSNVSSALLILRIFLLQALDLPLISWKLGTVICFKDFAFSEGITISLGLKQI